MTKIGKWTVALAVALALALVSPAHGQVDDSDIGLRNSSEIESRREALIEFIWGTTRLPKTKPTITPGIALPIPGITGVLGTDRLNFSMSNGVTTEGWHLIPSSGRKNRLVIVHNGHNICSFDDRATQSLPSSPPGSGQDGLWWTVQGLIAEGYDVLAMFMPRYSPNDCQPSGDQHGALATLPVFPGSPLKFFVEPVVMALNYFAALGTFVDLNMTGLSGGGWTTTIAAALDRRIKLSIPVAGSIPLYISANGDYEQVLADFYKLAGYPDLYVMGSHGRGRKQVQVVNRRDSCCFGEVAVAYTPTAPGWNNAVRAYEADARNAVRKSTRGAYRLEIDEGATHHTISYNAQVNIILAELNGARRPVGASTASNAFSRSSVSKLMWTTRSAHRNTHVSGVGVPAVLDNAEHSVDIFYRDSNRPAWSTFWAGGDVHLGDLGPTQRLRQAYLIGGTWAERELPTPALGLISDPVAVSSGAGSWDVVALAGDYRLYHWWWRPGFAGPSMEQVNGVDEIQTVSITGSPTGGTFRLTFEGQTSAAIPWNATNRQVRSALEALSNIWQYDVTVTGGPLPGAPVTVQFTNTLGMSNRGGMAADSALTGGSSPAAATSTLTQGVSSTKVAGQPAMTLTSSDTRSVIVRNFAGGLLHYSQDGTAAWVEQATSSPQIADHPTAAWDGTNLKVYARTRAGELNQGVLTGGTWSWGALPTAPAIIGSPSAAPGANTVVQARTATGRALTMTYTARTVTWKARSGKAAISDSPTAVASGAWARGLNGELLRWDTRNWTKRGTVFD